MAYLIKTGNLDDFSIRPAAKVLTSQKCDIITRYKDVLSNIKSYVALEQMQRSLAKENITFVPETLSQTGGLGLKSFTLYKNFEGLMNLFNPDNEIYFLAWAWDLSGKAPYVYPSLDTEQDKWFNRMKKNDSIVFIGEGLNLFPKQEIKGGVGVHIEVWESDKDIRKAGETIEKVTTTIQNSELTKVLTGFAASNPTTAIIAAISQAVVALTGEIGTILKNNSDDFVNLFEGFYDVDNWEKGSEVYRNPKNNPVCEIILNRF